MSLRNLIISRGFHASKILATPALSTTYKSQELWENRFQCPLLNDSDKIKLINSKILSDGQLDNTEVDIFINIAASRTDDITHLQEAAKILKRIRKSLYAHTLLPSTHHATCRLFLESDRVHSLVTLLEERVDFGIFPDAFALNLIFDNALMKEKLALASRAAALIMIQEEFGLNKMSDMFALYSTAKYIESKTDFQDWRLKGINQDAVFDQGLGSDGKEIDSASEGQEESKKEEEAEEEGDEEEDEEDAEYHRVPFLKNPYFDNHFDVTNPRIICGKTLSMLGRQLAQEQKIEAASECRILGNILQGSWAEAKNSLDLSLQSSQKICSSLKDLGEHYLNELHGVEAPSDQDKESLLSSLKKISQRDGLPSLSERAEQEFNKAKENERRDIEWLKRMLTMWSEMRLNTQKAMVELEARKKLIEEIKAKKEDLKNREEFLYFFDNLKKRTLTRINYD